MSEWQEMRDKLVRKLEEGIKYGKNFEVHEFYEIDEKRGAEFEQIFDNSDRLFEATLAALRKCKTFNEFLFVLGFSEYVRGVHDITDEIERKILSGLGLLRGE